MLASVTIVIRKSMKLSDLSFWASDMWFKNFLSLGGPCHMEGYWQFPRDGKGQQPEVIKECLKLNWYFKRGGGLKIKILSLLNTTVERRIRQNACV